MIDFDPLQKLPKNVRDLGKLIAAKRFKKLHKVQKIAQSGHTAPSHPNGFYWGHQCSWTLTPANSMQVSIMQSENCNRK